MLSQANLSDVSFKKGFLYERVTTNRLVTLETEYEQLKNTGRLYCMKMGWKEGMANKPHEFYDSDIAKWIEACAYSLATHKDPSLEEKVDEIIDIMATSQQPDGYLNTYYQTVEKNNRFTNLKDKHELYCAGHLIEAAVAYFQTTKKDKFLKIMCKYANLLCTIFGEEQGKLKGYPGHEEIELALVKLYSVTNNNKYLALSTFFVLERGKAPHYYDIERETACKSISFHHYRIPSLQPYAYLQAHVPVIEQLQLEGHAVRAFYYLSAVADIAYQTNNEPLKKACKRLYKNAVNKKMYITGGVGSSAKVENLSFEYDLPNETAYAETCAAIALAFFTQRMFLYEKDGQYMDVLEKVLYNGLLSGVSLDGTKFFYANPLQVTKKAVDQDTLYFKPQMGYERKKWFGCACCPPNLARFLASLGQYVYATDNDNIFVNLYTNSTFTHNNTLLTQTTNYPFDESINITINNEKSETFTLALRIPSWCKSYEIKCNNEVIKPTVKKGYLYMNQQFNDGDTIKLTLSMPVVKMQSNPLVRHNTNKLALMRGPIVYCAEQIDNTDITLSNLYLPKDDQFTVIYDEQFLGGCAYLQGALQEMLTTPFENQLYTEYTKNQYVETKITFIPYALWANREPGDMVIWINKLCL